MKDYNEDIRWWVDVIFYNLYLMLSELREVSGRRIQELVCHCERLIHNRREACKEMKEFFRGLIHGHWHSA